jgi:hypothetical protein
MMVYASSDLLLLRAFGTHPAQGVRQGESDVAPLLQILTRPQLYHVHQIQGRIRNTSEMNTKRLPTSLVVLQLMLTVSAMLALAGIARLIQEFFE